MGYHVIPVDEKYREIYSFTTPWGKFPYTRLPFGDPEAPDIFQHTMQTVLKDLDCVSVYLDDILVVSATFETHLQDLKLVFIRLQEFGFTVNGDKTTLLRKEIDYLGFVLSTNGIIPNPAKIDAIQRIQFPKSKKELRIFLGMVNYIRNFLPGIAHIIQPLCKLTGKNTLFFFDEKAKIAFLRTKEIVSSTTLMRHPNFQETLQVFADASQKGYGGVILQSTGPVVFYSRTYTKAENNYSVFEKELLAIVRLLTNFRSLLFGQRIQVYCDHKNLEYMQLSNERVLR